MKILFLSPWYPYPQNNGSKIRIYNLLRGLAQYHDVSLISFSDQPDVDHSPLYIESTCRDIQVVPWKPFKPHHLRAQLGLLSSTPRSIVDTFSPVMVHCIQEKLSTDNYDLVIASQIVTASYHRFFERLPAIFEEVELGVPYEQFANASSNFHRLRYGLTWAKHRRYLENLLCKYSACTVASERERELMYGTIPNYRSIDVIPNCVNVPDYQGITESPIPNTLVFTGSFHYRPNYDAMVWFVKNVFPHIQTQIPAVQLTITGDHAGQTLPSNANITQTGFVDDIRPMIAQTWVSIAPIFHGGGTRLKILEAMALRTPVVATTKGAEGLDVQHGENILIADTPRDFTDSVIRLMKDPGLRKRISDNAYELVSEKYDWNIIMPRFLRLVDKVAQL